MEESLELKKGRIVHLREGERRGIVHSGLLLYIFIHCLWSQSKHHLLASGSQRTCFAKLIHPFLRDTSLLNSLVSQIRSKSHSPTNQPHHTQRTSLVRTPNTTRTQTGTSNSRTRRIRRRSYTTRSRCPSNLSRSFTSGRAQLAGQRSLSCTRLTREA
jgi:hypothetical protein